MIQSLTEVEAGKMKQKKREREGEREWERKIQGVRFGKGQGR